MAKLLLLAVTVGAALAYPDKRIYSGSDAKPGAFPYMASLQTPTILHFCGGSIIGAKTILTAKHCLTDKISNLVDMYVVVGSINMASGERYELEYFVPHPSADLALIILDSPIKFSDKVRPIKLERKENDKERKCVLSGWGDYRDSTSKYILQFINLLTLPFDECRKLVPLKNGEMCTFTKEGEGACHGDSGSPLVANGWQIGVASWVYKGCARGNPDAYIRVSSYIDWINKYKN